MNHPDTLTFSKPYTVKSGLFFRNALRIFKNPHEFLSETAKTKGSIVKLNLAGKKYFLIQHPEYVKQVLLDRSKIYHKTGYKIVRKFIGDALVTSNGEAWAKKRKMIGPVFLHQKLEGMVEVMNEETTIFLKRTGNNVDHHPINITDELRLLTMSIISRTMFNTSLAEMDHIVKILEELREFSTRWMTGLIKIPINWPTRSNRRFRENKRVFDEIIYGIINKRKTSRTDPSDPKHNDMLDILLDHRDEETGLPMPDETVHDELTAMLIGGHETTTQILSWALFELARNREILLKVRAESDALSGDELPGYETISKLTYTRQVLNETLRLYPSFWLLSRRNTEDDHFNGFKLPSGSNILINLYGLHRHPAYWQNPETFDPGHFSPSSEEKRVPYVYFPFGVAPRICIGQHFAMLEMMIIISRVARTFDLEIPAGYVPKIVPDTTLMARGGIKLRIKKLIQ